MTWSLICRCLHLIERERERGRWRERKGEGEGRKRKDTQSEFRGLIKVLGLL